MIGGGVGSVIGGLFNDSGAPYDAAMDAYDKYQHKTEDTQNPFYNSGKSAMPEYEKWLQGQKDPSKFVNNLMSGYSESPWAKNEQNAAMRANTNAASASGLSGSTPMQLQGQQNATQISSQDQQQWLQNVLGINTQYGQGRQNQINTGQHAADELTNTYNNYGDLYGQAQYGQKAGENADFANLIGGAAQVGAGIAML